MDAFTSSLNLLLISMLLFELCMTDPIDDLTININMEEKPKGSKEHEMT